MGVGRRSLPRRTGDGGVLGDKRPLEPSAGDASAVRLKWVRRTCGRGGESLQLESFELVEGMEQPEPDPRVSIEAVALLTRLMALPPQLVVTATVPLDMCIRGRDPLLPLTPSAAQQISLADEPPL